MCAAQNADLDFIVLTDHNTLKARKEGYEGWHDDLLVLVGEEVSHRKQHCLAVGVNGEIDWKTCPAQILKDIREKGGLSFIAHPHGRYRPYFRKKQYHWESWQPDSFTGIELWSYMFDWVSDFRFYKWRDFIEDPSSKISGPYPETIALWDRLCQNSKVVAIGGLDIHARRTILSRKVVVFPYEWAFGTLRTRVLVPERFSGDSQKDVQLVLNALADGHCFIAYDLLSPAEGSILRIADGSAIMGDEVEWNPELELDVVLPRPCGITIFRDGRRIQKTEDDNFIMSADSPGVYRAEATLDGKPWIYFNPIYLRRPKGIKE